MLGTADQPSLVERTREWLAPVVAFVASCLAVGSVVSIPDLSESVVLLSFASERYVGWAGVAAALCIGVAGVSVLWSDRLGAATPLAVGAVAAVFGLALGDTITDGRQVNLSLLVLGLAFGGLVSGGGLVVAGLSGWMRLVGVGAWALPLVAAWPLVTWAQLHEIPGTDGRLTLPPPGWLLAVAAGVIVLWASVAVLLQSARPGPVIDAGWQAVWFGLFASSAVACLAVMLVGFEPALSLDWVRPVALLSTSVVALGLVLAVRAVPSWAGQASYTGILIALLTAPTCIQLMVIVADDGDARVDRVAVLAMAAAGLVGGLVAMGWQPERVLPVGLLVMAGGAAGSWVLPSTQWPMVAGGAFLVMGAGATVLAGLRLAARHSVGWRCACLVVVVALTLGLLSSAPLSWTLGGSVADTVEDARATGRVALGLTFALAVLGAAVTAILLGRLPRQPTAPPSGQVSGARSQEVPQT